MSIARPVALATASILLTLFSTGCFGPPPPPVAPGEEPVPGMSAQTFSLSQGWSSGTRQKFWFTGQGSQVIPRIWLLALEQASGSEPFRSAATFDRFRYLPTEPTPMNPDGWPLGFAVSKDRATQVEWVGYTCSGCHTGRVDYGGKSLIIDGGASLADLYGFFGELIAAMQATLNDQEKFARFAGKVLGSDATEAAAAQLRSELTALAGLQTERIDGLAPSSFARLDAFGSIFNQVLAMGLGLPENAQLADAAVSYPFIWDASHTDWVQWNGAVSNRGPQGPLGRNVAEALGVFGNFTIDTTLKRGYPNSIEMKKLGDLELWLKSLWSPVWPEGILPALDSAQVERGKGLYQQHCLSCHQLPDRTKPDRIIKAKLVPVDQVGTDSRTTLNFARRRAKTGRLEGAKEYYAFGKPLGAEAHAMQILNNVGVGAIANSPQKGIEAAFKDFEGFYRGSGQHDPVTDPAYKARPLNGIWATAPYLHNGSVPNLWEVLLPPEQRSKSFYVGSRNFDPKKVGFETGPSADAAEFKAEGTGATNSGHSYGKELTEAERWAMLEYLKSL